MFVLTCVTLWSREPWFTHTGEAVDLFYAVLSISAIVWTLCCMKEFAQINKNIISGLYKTLKFSLRNISIRLKVIKIKNMCSIWKLLN